MAEITSFSVHSVSDFSSILQLQTSRVTSSENDVTFSLSGWLGGGGCHDSGLTVVLNTVLSILQSYKNVKFSQHGFSVSFIHTYAAQASLSLFMMQNIKVNK